MQITREVISAIGCVRAIRAVSDAIARRGRLDSIRRSGPGESLASRTARALVLNLAPSLAGEVKLQAIPGGVRLGDTDIELLVDAEEARLGFDGLHTRAFVLMADGCVDDRLIADIQYFDMFGRRHRLFKLNPWIDPRESDLWFICSKSSRGQAIRLLPDGLKRAEHAPASCMRTLLSGFDHADHGVRDWRRAPTEPPPTWEQMLARGLI